jgi:hypothetical protein
LRQIFCWLQFYQKATTIVVCAKKLFFKDQPNLLASKMQDKRTIHQY